MLFAEIPIHRLSIDDVRRMADVGILGEEERVELLDGVLVDMSPPGAAHSSTVAWLTNHLTPALGERELRVQDLLLVEGGFLMPDVMVVDKLPRDQQPSTAALVIEVSVTTQRYDEGKGLRYARAGWRSTGSWTSRAMRRRPPRPEAQRLRGDRALPRRPAGRDRRHRAPIDVADLLG